MPSRTESIVWCSSRRVSVVGGFVGHVECAGVLIPARSARCAAAVGRRRPPPWCPGRSGRRAVEHLVEAKGVGSEVPVHLVGRVESLSDLPIFPKWPLHLLVAVEVAAVPLDDLAGLHVDLPLVAVGRRLHLPWLNRRRYGSFRARWPRSKRTLARTARTAGAALHARRRPYRSTPPGRPGAPVPSIPLTSGSTKAFSFVGSRYRLVPAGARPLRHRVHLAAVHLGPSPRSMVTSTQSVGVPERRLGLRRVVVDVVLLR